MHRRVLAIAALLALAACRSGGADEPRTTVPTAPATTTTTAASYGVPAVIDVPYIEKVMAALDHVEGEAIRHLASGRQLDERFLRYLIAIYTTEAVDMTKEAWQVVADHDFKDLAKTPMDPHTTVGRLISADNKCILFSVNRDFSPAFAMPDPPRPEQFVALVPAHPEDDPDRRNPTPWVMGFEGRYKDGTEPKREDVCTAP